MDRYFLILLLQLKVIDDYPLNSAVLKSEMNTSISEENNDLSIQNEEFDVMMLLQCIIASVGIIANLTVVTVFLNHKELRRKIPNRFIINQVSSCITKLPFHLENLQLLCAFNRLEFSHGIHSINDIE